MDLSRTLSRLLPGGRESDLDLELQGDDEDGDDARVGPEVGVMRNVMKDPWLLLLAVCLLCFLPFCALGATWTGEGRPDLSDEANLYGADALAPAMVPGVCFILILNLVGGRIMSYHLGMDMLQETSTDFKDVLRDYELAIERAKGRQSPVRVMSKCGRDSYRGDESVSSPLLKRQAQEAFAGVKKTTRDISKTSGVMLSLILLAVLPLHREGLPFEQDNVTLAIWFRILTLGSAMTVIKGLLVSTLFLAYIEPLGETAAVHFAFDNVNYLGEPVADIILGLVCFLPALCLWTFGMFGSYYGAVTCIMAVYTLTRFLLVFNRLSSWRNWIDVSESQRRRRKQIYRIQAELAKAKKAEARGQRSKSYAQPTAQPTAQPASPVKLCAWADSSLHTQEVVPSSDVA